jgi:secondary thiamine-phosphate synthase enzyme
MLKQSSGTLEIEAANSGLHLITDRVADWLQAQDINSGILTIFCRHTSASLLIQENAAPAARRDLEAYFARIAPEDSSYEHDDEGADDMPAHLRSALTQSQLSIPVGGGRMLLGRWQGIYLFEHRRDTSPRELALHVVGE